MRGLPGRALGRLSAAVAGLCALGGAACAQAPAASGDAKTPEQPPPPQITKSETSKIDSWLVTCVEFASGPRKRACSARLQINQQNSNNVVFVWEIGTTADRKTLSVLQVPTGVLIEPGLELHVGKAPPRKFGYTSCEPSRCLVSFATDEKLAKDLSATPKIDAVIKGVNGSTITFQIETAGLDKAYPQVAR